MSLTPQVIALLRAATEPLSTTQLRDQLKAMGVWNNGDVNKRVYALCERNVVERVGGGRDTRYQLVTGDKLNQIEARSNARATAVTNLGRRVGRRDGAPTFRDHLLKVIETTPGITVPAIKLALRDAGMALGKNEPSAALHVLARQGRVGHVGEQPNRRYYRPIDMPEMPAATATAPTEAKPAKAVATERSTPAPAAPPIKRISDSPIDRLADAIEQHLELIDPARGPWISATLIAEEIDEDPLDVAKALRRLVDAKRASVRTVDDVREYAFGVVAWTPEPISTPRPLPETQTGLGAGASEGAAVAPIASDDTAHPPSRHCMCAECAPSFEPTPCAAIPPIPPAYCPGEVRFVPDLDAAKAAQSPAQQATATRIEHLLDISDAAKDSDRLDQSIGWVLRDIEDLVGRACDRRADHRVIKSITTAAFALSRATEYLHTAGSAPASPGVPQS